MRKLFMALASALTIIAAPAFAAPAAGPDPAAVTAAEHLLDSIEFDSHMDKVVEQISAQVKRQFAAEVNGKLDQALPDDLMQSLQRVVDDHFHAIFNAHRAELKRATALEYAAHFSAAELNRLAVIEADPLLKKFRDEEPELAASGMALGHSLAERERPQLEADLKAAVEDYYRNHGKSVPVSLNRRLGVEHG